MEKSIGNGPPPWLVKKSTVLILIPLGAFLVYLNVLKGPFLLDDYMYIVENRLLGDLAGFLDLSGSRYVGHLTFALNFVVNGYDTFGYHLVNVLVHAINGLLLWYLVRLTYRSPVMSRGGRGGAGPACSPPACFIAFGAALLFITHPVQTQAVSYITQRFTSLAALFYLLSLVLYARWRLAGIGDGGAGGGGAGGGGRTLIYAASIVSALLAMKTKEISFTLPFVIVLYEFAFFTSPAIKGRLAPLVPYLLTLFIIPLALFWPGSGPGQGTRGIAEAIRGLQLKDLETISSYDYLLTQFSVVVTYLRLLIVPVGQHVDYDYPIYRTFFDGRVLVSFVFLAGLFGSAVYFFIKSRASGNAPVLLASFGVLWFFITLSVESSIIPIADVLAEHRLYLPSAGIFISFAAALYYAFNRAAKTAANRTLYRYPLAVVLVLALVFSVATHLRNRVFADELRFSLDEVAKSPDKGDVHYNLGVVYAGRGLTDQAIKAYSEAIRLDPESVTAHNNLGNTYQALGRTQEAMDEYNAALAIKPDFVEARNNLGTLYYTEGRSEEAFQEYNHAIRINPRYAKAHFNLAVYYRDLGDMVMVLEELEKAVELRPDYLKARINLGLAYYRLGHLDKAIDEYSRALDYFPDNAQARNNLGAAYLMSDRIDEAIEEYREVVRLLPRNEDARYNLGNAYRAKGLSGLARGEFEEVLRMNPDHEPAKQGLRELSEQ